MIVLLVVVTIIFNIQHSAAHSNPQLNKNDVMQSRLFECLIARNCFKENGENKVDPNCERGLSECLTELNTNSKDETDRSAQEIMVKPKMTQTQVATMQQGTEAFFSNHVAVRSDLNIPGNTELTKYQIPISLVGKNESALYKTKIRFIIFKSTGGSNSKKKETNQTKTNSTPKHITTTSKSIAAKSINKTTASTHNAAGAHGKHSKEKQYAFVAQRSADTIQEAADNQTNTKPLNSKSKSSLNIRSRRYPKNISTKQLQDDGIAIRGIFDFGRSSTASPAVTTTEERSGFLKSIYDALFGDLPSATTTVTTTTTTTEQPLDITQDCSFITKILKFLASMVPSCIDTLLFGKASEYANIVCS